MRIRVRFYGLVHDEVCSRELEYHIPDNSTILYLVERITENYQMLKGMVYDEDNRFRDYLELAINQTSIISLNGVDTILQEGDLVQLMPPIGGG